MREPLVVLTADLRVQSANAAFYRAFDVDAVAGRGTRLPDLDSVLLAIEDVTEAVANEAERRRFLFSRIDAGQESLAPAAADLNVILREVNAVLEPLAAQSGIGFATRVIDAPDSVVLDAPKVRQLLVNRASNAVQFTDEGRVGVTVGQADGELVFAVTDTGMGIAADDVPHLFEPFWQGGSNLTRRAGGTGLGLAFVKRLVDMMRGSIEVISTPGQGSTFRVRLPVQPVQPQAAE